MRIRKDGFTLVAGCDDLMSIRGKDKVRAKAKEMLESLQ